LFGSYRIRLNPVRMLAPVELHHQLLLQANEVHDVTSTLFLPAKFEAPTNPPHPGPLPKRGEGRGRIDVPTFGWPVPWKRRRDL
jgi:hypothetical protein